MTPIVRIYATEAQARSAVTAVEGVPLLEAEAILLLTPTPGAEGAAVEAAVREGRFPGSHRAIATRSLAAGRSVICVQAPFSMGVPIEEVLDAHDPVDTGHLPRILPRNPAPFSSAFGLPVLWRKRSTVALTPPDFLLLTSELDDDPTPLSSLFRLPVLSRGKSKSSSFGLPLLTNKAAPLSSLFGMKTLTAGKSKSSSFGLPLLTRNATPLSSLLGLPVLTKRDRTTAAGGPLTRR